VLSDANSNYSQAMLTVFVDGGGIDCGADQFAFYQFNGNVTQCSGVVAALNTWHHVAVTRDAAGTRRFFVDGVLRSTQTNTAAPVDSNGVFALGRAGDSATEHFAGLIDEVRVSSAALYTANFAPSTAPLSVTAQTVGLWSLDEGSGQVVADRSGNGRHGTLGATSSADDSDPTWVADSSLPGGGPTAAPAASA
ncbi:MAG: LamG domain-containing protein, partial [Anaerolineales bacterium]